MIVTSADILEILDRVKALGYRRFRLEHEGLTLEVDEEAGSAGAAPAAAGAGAQPQAARAVTAQQQPRTGLVAITAPMNGTFYRSSAPGAPPFVEVGSHVEASDVVCIIEVMKLFNSIQAGVAGTIREIAAGNEQPVLAGEAVLWIEPETR